jgi:hypothetical protein
MRPAALHLLIRLADLRDIMPPSVLVPTRERLVSTSCRWKTENEADLYSGTYDSQPVVVKKIRYNSEPLRWKQKIIHNVSITNRHCDLAHGVMYVLRTDEGKLSSGDSSVIPAFWHSSVSTLKRGTKISTRSSCRRSFRIRFANSCSFNHLMEARQSGWSLNLGKVSCTLTTSPTIPQSTACLS